MLIKEKEMKISKMLLVSLLGVVVIGGAMADEYDGPRNRCQSKSDKIWVESTKACIPENPCKDSEYEKAYCNRAFANFQSPAGTDLYIDLINLYAENHALNCKAVPKESKLVGQDYVVCKGTDVMVFEFDDINDHALHNVSNYLNDLNAAVCVASGGQMQNKKCETVHACSKFDNMIENISKVLTNVKTFLLREDKADGCTILVNEEEIKATEKLVHSLMEFSVP